ncbi:MAG: hypothetical protein RL693_2186 [Verrucomicrobiota bacterium]|jgi:hypothetical protein
MPQWIYNRPPENCNETELRLAKLLNHELGADWLVRWGYWYHDNKGTLREGDFLILSPTGGVLVLEVKTSLSHLQSTGHWGENDSDNPVTQLMEQHAGVLRMLKDVAKGRHMPFVAKSLALPAIEVATNISEFRSVPRDLILAANDFRDFPNVWRKLLAGHRVHADEQRELFLEAFGEEILPKNVKAFVSETDKLILRQAIADFRFLDMLSGNQQLLVEGGVGTGKSWYAIEQARRFAENRGGDVLIVAYNLALCERLRSNVSKLHLKRGSITVRSSEQIAAEILNACGISHDVPSAKIDAQIYFDETLPQLALEALSTETDKLQCFIGKFDALVVDEAQDHDTQLHSDGSSGNTDCGWWSIYTLLLKNGWQSSMAIFGDVAQRPPFRAVGRFNFDALRGKLSQHAHVRLESSLRYTRQILRFLQGLKAEGTDRLVSGLKSGQQLLDGPEVLLKGCASEDTVKIVEEVLAGWLSAGLCSPSKVLILYDRSTIDRTVLAGLESLHDHDLMPILEVVDNAKQGTIGHTSIHKAKGLDSLAVILLGLRSFEELSNASDRFTYFMGASRARQLLACVHVTDEPSAVLAAVQE